MFDAPLIGYGRMGSGRRVATIAPAREVNSMSTALALLVVWSIVAMALWCCYRLWYWTPTASASVAADEPSELEAQPRAA